MTFRKSVRNCSFRRSPPNGKSLWTERSQVINPGARRILRPEFPNWPAWFFTNALVSNHCINDCCLELEFIDSGACATSARSFPTAVREMSDPVRTEKGAPVWNLWEADRYQPP